MNTLNDSLDDLIFGQTGEVRTPAAIARAPETFKTAVERFEERCSKCRGSGQTPWGPCFKCRGAGKKVFKTSPESRAQNRTATAARKDRVEQEGVEAFKAANPAEFAWLEATAPRWDVARSLLDGLKRYGSLTEGRMTLIRNGIARDAARATQAAARVADAPAVDASGIDRLKTAFDKARAYAAEKGLKLKVPKITIGGITISPAGAQSKNPGALYVKDAGVYVGKIAGGRFHAQNANGADVAAKVQAFITNPAEAAKVYGQTTGVCCVCNATLTSKWKLRGIGPICAEKMGWAGLAEDFGVKL